MCSTFLANADRPIIVLDDSNAIYVNKFHTLLFLSTTAPLVWVFIGLFLGLFVGGYLIPLYGTYLKERKERRKKEIEEAVRRGLLNM